MAGGQGLFHPKETYDGGGCPEEDKNAEMKERVIAMWMILHADKIRFGGLLNKMKDFLC